MGLARGSVWILLKELENASGIPHICQYCRSLRALLSLLVRQGFSGHTFFKIHAISYLISSAGPSGSFSSGDITLYGKMSQCDCQVEASC